MDNRTLPTDLSQKIFSLPFSAGDCPFDLSEAERKLKPDHWAWLFLRLNPLYQHDYVLWKAQAVTMPALLRPNGPIVPLAPGAPATSVPEALRQLDSRHFALDGAPLGGRLDHWTFVSETLGAYLDAHPEVDLRAIRVREFDAPGDYGIGAWLDPATLHPPELPHAPATGRGSWFHHVNEPIWEVHPEAVMQAKMLLHELPDGQWIAFGRDHYARASDTMCKAGPDRAANPQDEFAPPQQRPRTIPLLPSSTSTALAPTQVRFLVCLDGYVRPQVDMAFALASECRELHREHNAAFITGSTLAEPVKIEAPLVLSGRSTGIFVGLSGAAVRVRKNWCAVTIDVAGPLGGQQEHVEAALLKMQKALGKALTFAIRLRSPNEKSASDNPLKRALCTIELRMHGDTRRKRRSVMPYGLINQAIYCNDTYAYYNVRDQPVKPAVKQNKGGLPELGNLENVRASLKLGRGMALGWYELLASRKF